MFLLFNVLLKNIADESYCREQMRLIFGVHMKHLVYFHMMATFLFLVSAVFDAMSEVKNDIVS